MWPILFRSETCPSWLIRYYSSQITGPARGSPNFWGFIMWLHYVASLCFHNVALILCATESQLRSGRGPLETKLIGGWGDPPPRTVHASSVKKGCLSSAQFSLGEFVFLFISIFQWRDIVRENKRAQLSERVYLSLLSSQSLNYLGWRFWWWFARWVLRYEKTMVIHLPSAVLGLLDICFGCKVPAISLLSPKVTVECTEF